MFNPFFINTKHNIIDMAIERKVEKNFKVGITGFKVIALNPGLNTLQKLKLAKDDAEEPEYIGQDDEGYDKAKLEFYILQDGCKDIQRFTLFFTKKQATFGEGGAARWINSDGKMGSGDTVDYVISDAVSYAENNNYKTEGMNVDYRPLFVGEDILHSLFKTKYKGYFEHKDFEDLFKGKFNTFTSVFVSDVKFTALFGMNDAGYMTIYTGAFGNNNDIINRIIGRTNNKKAKKQPKPYSFKSQYPKDYLPIWKTELKPTVPDNIEEHMSNENEDNTSNDDDGIPF